MKEKSYADEVKLLEDFRESRNEWFLKEEKKKRSRKVTLKVQEEEGLSSQPKQKRQKKKVETMLVDEPEEDEAEDNIEIDVCLSRESERLLKSLIEYNAEPEKTTGDEEGDNVDQSSSNSSDEEIDETECARRIKVEIEKEKQLTERGKKIKMMMCTYHLLNMLLNLKHLHHLMVGRNNLQGRELLLQGQRV
ncbi:hypothetical protein Hanom_Chr06g00549281 [Helianthus anomalus]